MIRIVLLEADPLDAGNVLNSNTGDQGCGLAGKFCVFEDKAGNF